MQEAYRRCCVRRGVRTARGRDALAVIAAGASLLAVRSPGDQTRGGRAPAASALHRHPGGADGWHIEARVEARVEDVSLVVPHRPDARAGRSRRAPPWLVDDMREVGGFCAGRQAVSSARRVVAPLPSAPGNLSAFVTGTLAGMACKRGVVGGEGVRVPRCAGGLAGATGLCREDRRRGSEHLDLSTSCAHVHNQLAWTRRA